MFQPDSFKINAKVAAILVLVALGCTQHSLQAQDVKAPVTISSVSTHSSANGTLVTIAADGPLNRSQTWQDREGYHVVVPSAGAERSIKVGSGIKVRQLDSTLEIVIQTKPGANVTVQSFANRLNVNVEGKLESSSSDTDSANAKSGRDETAEESLANASADGDKSLRSDSTVPLRDSVASTARLNESGPATSANHAASDSSGEAPSKIAATEESSVMSGATVLIVLGAVILGGLFILHRRRSGAAAAKSITDDEGFEEFNDLDDEALLEDYGAVKGAPGSLMKTNNNSSNGSSTQRKSVTRLPVSMPAALYGAYQVDLEVGKLVQGQPHRMDVVASRAQDDRRAIEASLMKSINATGDEGMQRRAREALEEYGFVARQSATLLAASDPYERSSAARMLGDIKSPAALPFLLEALYDSEALVRNQAVLSIGELRLPSAIGALLDIARKHPDVPGSLLSRALNACSLEGLDFFDSNVPEPRLLSGVDARLLAEELIKLEPAAAAEELPDSAEDESFAHALTKVHSQTVTERSDAIKVLQQFSVKSSVAALANLARSESEASLRAAAIAGLSCIDHESVFPAILIAMADESREVRAAAARSLSRLSFDRADAYIRVTKGDDLELLREVAEACLKAGIAKQGIDRLANSDHQAYESMSVVSLLVKAKTFELLLDAAANHPNMDVRLTVIHLLGLTHSSDLVEVLRNMLSECSIDEMREALSEAIAELEPRQAESDTEAASETQLQPETVDESVSNSEFDPEASGVEFETRTENEMSTGFAYEFAPDLSGEAGAEPERSPQPPDLESSGLATPPIA